MDIMSLSQAVHVDKPDGTRVDYYVFSEYEIHYTVVSPGTLQEWHHHEAIEEALLIVDGEMDALWQDDRGSVTRQRVCSGDVVRVGRSVHSFENRSASPVRFAVFRLVLDGSDKRALIRRDKILDDAPSCR